MEDKKMEVVSSFRPMIKELVELVKAFDTCLMNSKVELDVEAATSAMRLLVPLQNRMVELVNKKCYELGSFGTSLIGFVNFQFKGNVQGLVEGMKTAIASKDLGPFSLQVSILKNQPRSLVDILKTASDTTETTVGEQLWRDKSDPSTKPNEKHLPKVVLLLTDYGGDFGRAKMIEGIKAYFDVKDMVKEGVAFVKVKRMDKGSIETLEPEIQLILKKFNLEELKGYPVFIMIKDTKYYWFRNTSFKASIIRCWIEDILSDMAYMTGNIPWAKIPQNVQYFWKDKGDLSEPLSRSPLKLGPPALQNLIEMGEAPDIWNPLWFVAVSDTKFNFFLNGLLDFHVKWGKSLNPLNAQEWNYQYIIPGLIWPGWSKIDNLATTPIENRIIETAVGPLKEFLVVADQKGVPLQKSPFYYFFEGEPEPEPEEKPTFEIGEIGKIDVKWNDDDWDIPHSKKSPPPKQNSQPSKPKTATPKAKQEQSGTATVQDQVFDYLGEMLKKNVLNDETKNEDDYDDVDLDNL